MASAWAEVLEGSGGRLRGGSGGAPQAKGFKMPPDTRPEGCSDESVFVDPKGLDFQDMKVSIIIPYRREKLDHIRGTLASILHFTPQRYLNEIMMVSDGNEPNTAYLDALRTISPLISLFVLPPPGVGLIAAKMRAVGAVAVDTQVLVFLEPHTRVNINWLEALLVRIRKFPRVLAMPFLDIIPQDNFDGYRMGSAGHWRFEWNLNLIYTDPGHRHVTSEPYMSPATSGGIFAIRRDWWQRLGFYDAGMVGWGGDHLEATFKVWRCGGHIEMVTCSRIGHLFRDAAHRPYDVQVPQVVQNYARFAEVWLDEYKPLFQKLKPEVVNMQLGDLTAAKRSRAQLKCENMTWFLHNVEREMLHEKDRLCIPGCPHAANPFCCEHGGEPGRATIDRGGAISAQEYVPLPPPEDFQGAEVATELNEFEL